MSRPGRESLPNEDSVLLDYARRLNKFRKSRRAVRIFVSRLRPHNRRDHHLRIVASTFEPLIRKFDGAIFHLYNQDMVVICNGAKVSDIQNANKITDPKALRAGQTIFIPQNSTQ